MNPANLFNTRFAQLLIGLIMAVAWLAFSLLHVRAFNVSGNWVNLVFCATETLTAMFFIMRTTPVTVSGSRADWILAFVGTFAALLFVPSGNGILPGAAILIYVGAVMHLGGMLSLNRSIGMVPARRIIKTGGLYRLVRHPLYASYIISSIGYLLINTSPRNVTIFAGTAALLTMRLLREERHLALDKNYREYMARVKFRVLPFVF